MTFASVCSGIGAPECAWAPLGWHCAFVSEIEKFPCSVLKHHYPDAPNYGDMTRFHEWPEHKLDLLVGGTPCQSFSLAGLRKGMADPRGNLALTFLAIIKRYAPTWVVWENVAGVHSSWSDVATGVASEKSRAIIEAARRAVGESGVDLGAEFGLGEFEEADQSNDFDCFLGGLAELRYGIATRILDAQYFGVPQRRRRVFVVGHIGGDWRRAAAVLFERESLCGHPAPRRETGKRIAGTFSARTEGGGGLGTDFESGGGIVESPRPLEPSAAGLIGKTNIRSCSQNHSAIGIDSENNAHVELAGTLNHLSPSRGGHPAAVAIGVDGGEIGYALRSEASHSGDKGDGGVNTTLVAHSLKAEGHDASEDGTGRGAPLVPEIVSSVTSKWSKGSGGPSGWPSGDEVQNLIAFSCKDHGADASQDISPTLRSLPHNESHANGGGPPAIAYRTSGNCGVMEQGDKSAALNTATDPNQNILMQKMAVRRLTPRECERLQGFPDDYTLIHPRVADGPRYKALGNSMAVPVMHWIGLRIRLVENLKVTRAAAD